MTPGSAARRRPGRPPGTQAGEGQEALLEAARALMAEKGLPRVTVREVAERAGVQPALVHYYFGGKDGLLRAVATEVAGRMRENMRRAATVEGTVEERLRALVHAVVQSCVDEPYAPRLVMEQVMFAGDEMADAFAEGYARPNLENVQDLLEEGADAGVIRRVDPLYLMPSLFGGCMFFFLSSPVILRMFELDSVTPEIAEGLADYTVDVLLNGIRTRPEEAP